MGDEREPFNPTSVDWVIKIGCLAALIFWSLLLLQPFLAIIVWSVILAVVLYPIFDWSVMRLHLNRVVAAILITLLCFFVVIGPATWLGVSLVGSVRSIVAKVNAGTLSIPPPWETIRHWPFVGQTLYDFWNLASVNLGAAFAELSPELKPLGSTMLSVAGSAGVSTLQFVAAVAISGFLFVPGPSLVADFKTAVNRVASTRGAEFVDLAGATIRNLARGVIGIALLQALLAGLGLIVAGIPAAGLWSFLVLVLGIAQVGATVVLILPVVWSWFTMDTTAALIFTAYMVPVALLDNFLRPLVLAHGLKTPMPVILIGVIGGILVHGVIGVFIGPIVLAIAWELMRAWTRGDVEEELREADAAGPQA